jgi:L-fuculose-phosphate aldolase
MFEAGREAVVRGLPTIAALTPGRSGNLSVRDGDRVAITPSGVPYGEIEPADVPVLTIDGTRLHGDLEPSSEVPMHLGIYRELDVGAIAHVHSPWATTLAVLREPLPTVHYMLALAGGEVPVAPYATYGTEALAQNAVDAMSEQDTTACLLANHGLVATGTDVESALETLQAVESTARVYLQARSVGEPAPLGEVAMEAVYDQLESYGQPEET